MIILKIIDLTNKKIMETYKVDNQKIAEIYIAKFICKQTKQYLNDTKEYYFVTMPDGKKYITSPRYPNKKMVFDELKENVFLEMLPFHAQFLKDKFNYIIEK